jgi:DNA invertase Pin-like site-specific DNA recombinase
MTTKTKPLAAGGIRISELNGRGKEDKHGKTKRLHSDDDQRDKLDKIAKEYKLDLDYVFEEMDTSGTLALEQRPKLLAAVERVERGELKAIIFPYRDRSDRSIATMTEVVRRIDAADGLLISGGSVLTHKSADQWARSVLESFANEMPARYAKEKVRAAHERAIAEGIPPYRPVSGLDKVDGRFVVVAELAPVIREAFRMRDRGESINTIRRYLAEHGIKRSYAGVESILRSPSYLGLVVFGDLAYRGEGVEADDQTVEPVPAFEAIIDADLWHRVQVRKATRGRQAKSDRLLARQGVLRCETCGSRMTATNNRGFAFYRCQHNASPDCQARATVSAERVEALVVERLKARRELARLEGFASADLGEQLHQAARDAQADVEAAVEAFAGVEGLGAAKKRIGELTEAWKAAEREAEQHDRTEGARSAMRRIDDWDRLDLDIRRGIIRAVIDQIVVAPVGGLGLSGSKWDESRVDLQFVGESTPGSLVK